MGRIRGFIEKPDWTRVVTDLVNTGIYVLDPAVLELIPPGLPYDFARDLFPRLMEMGKPLFGLPMKGYWRDIGEPESYYQCNLDALRGVLRLPGSELAAKAETPRPQHRRYRCSVTVETPQRARLMRAVSAALMEAGADFTDGITLGSAPGGLHIAAAADRDCILVESDEEETVRKYKEMADGLQLAADR